MEAFDAVSTWICLEGTAQVRTEHDASSIGGANSSSRPANNSRDTGSNLTDSDIHSRTHVEKGGNGKNSLKAARCSQGDEFVLCCDAN